MCIPYLIPDPPPSKRPRKSGLIVERRPHNSPRLQPAIIEISPRLTYVASPRPDRSPLPPKARSSNLRPLQCQEVEAFKDPKACKKAPDDEEGKPEKSDPKPEAPKQKSTPAPPATTPKPDAPCKETPPAAEKPPSPQRPQPQPQPQPPPPTKQQSPPPPSTPAYKPHSHSCPSSPPLPTHNYHQHRPHHRSRSRSPSPSSTISRRTFERLRRNLYTVLERVRALEAEKESWEAEKRRMRGRREWEGGRRADGGRREGSFVRERREGGGWGDERGRDRWRGEGGRWERECGGLGMGRR